MNDNLQILKNNFNAKLDHVDVMGDLAIFTLKVQEEYFDTIFKATYDMSSAFNRMVLQEDLVTSDFKKLYSNEEFRNLINQLKIKPAINSSFAKY